MKISTFGNIKHKSPKKHRLTKKHISSKKVNKNHNKKHRSTKKVNKKHIKNHIKKHKKIYKGGVKETDGFIIQVDDFNMPVENSLDYENAEIFLTNFLFNDNFIKTYLEKDTESLLTFLKSPEIKLYSGDEEQLDNLIEELISKNMNSFLKLYKIVDPKSYEEFIGQGDVELTRRTNNIRVIESESINQDLVDGFEEFVFKLMNEPQFKCTKMEIVEEFQLVVSAFRYIESNEKLDNRI